MLGDNVMEKRIVRLSIDPQVIFSNYITTRLIICLLDSIYDLRKKIIDGFVYEFYKQSPMIFQ